MTQLDGKVIRLKIKYLLYYDLRVHLFHKLSGFQSINKAAREYSDRRAYSIDGDTSPPPIHFYH